MGKTSTSHFLALKVNILKTVGDTAKVTVNHQSLAYALSIDTKFDDLEAVGISPFREIS